MEIMRIPAKKVVKVKIENIFEFLSPEYLKIFISSLLNKLLKKNWVEIKNINGNISKTNIGVLISDKYKGNNVLTSLFLKKSNSVSKLRTNIKLKKTKKTFNKDVK